MKLFRAPQTRSQRGIWMLEEVGLNYGMERIHLGVPERKDSDESLPRAARIRSGGGKGRRIAGPCDYQSKSC